MKTALIIGTHGGTAEQLLKSTEMIIGQQENVACIDFIPGENTDTLIQKFKEKLQTLQTDDGVLFMVDLYGGSPFNAASQISITKDHYDVVTGVNIPMLLETLSTRSSLSFEELVNAALNAGSQGIRSLKGNFQSTEEESEEEL